MRILVTGSRDWDDEDAIYNALRELDWKHGYENLTLVHGACPTGADDIAQAHAIFRGWRVERHPAKWFEYGKRAGFLRNAEMVSLGADLCLAFIKNGSRGATHTADLAEKAGIPVIRYTA